MEVGNQFLLVNESPYLLGLHNEEPVEFIVATIIEEKVGKGEFTGKEDKGYLARGSDGLYYGYNYPTVNEGMSSGIWVRHMPDELFLELSQEEKEEFVRNYMWKDITLFQCPAEALPAKELDFIEYCEKHQKHFYTRKSCFYCKHIPDFQNKVHMNMEEHAWTGWY